MNRSHVRCVVLSLFALFCVLPLHAQIPSWMPDPTHQQTYTLHRSSSREQTGANADYRTVTPGQTMTILDTSGPGMVSHVWFTLNAPEPYSLKRIVLRIYWDDETTPSVETPIGDFFGLGNGLYYMWQSPVLSVGNDHAMNCWFPCRTRNMHA